MATNYDIDYNDKRFTEVESDKKEALSDLEETYSDMLAKSDQYYQAQIDASKQWADKQSQLQQEQTDFAIKEINQQKEQAKKDYTKEQSGAYVDWQKQSNQYGANSEEIAAGGMTNTGFAESSQVSMYNTYQNRVATAREAYDRAVLNYNNSITQAQLQNSSVLAEIAYEALQKQLELSLQGFQYKNQLILDKANKKTELENSYYQRYQDVLAQINHENALAEQIRQYNASLAEEQRQYNQNYALQQAKLAEEKRQFESQYQLENELQEAQINKIQKTITKNTSNPTPKSGTKKSTSGAKKSTSSAASSKLKSASGNNGNKGTLTYSDVAATAAQLRRNGASKAEINQYLNTTVQSSKYKPTTSVSQDLLELTSGYVGHSGR